MSTEERFRPARTVGFPMFRTILGLTWAPIVRWLARVPIADPVDRRNAPMLQVLSLLLAGLPTLAWLYRIFATTVPWRPGETSSMLLSFVVSAAAALSFVLIRYGRFKWASRQLLVVFAVTVIPAYAATGFTAQRFEQPLLVIWMAVAGLVIGRGALWFMYACVLVAFAVGIRVDAAGSAEAAYLASDAAISGAIFLLIAVVMDRSVAALRESLREANERGNQLEHTNARLETEIAEREKVQQQLLHAQKIEAVGRLASGVAHDFGNLLGVMLGYAARGRRLDDPQELKQALAGVESAARRAAAVTRKLLSFSRQDETRLEVFDAAAALREMKPTLWQLFDPSVALVFELPEQAQPIHFDRSQFELAVLNIAANANQAMPGGGSFGIALKPDAPETEVVVEFRDNGHGMSEQTQQRAFEPFFTTRAIGQGTGLGLAVVKDLVDKARGRITIDSAPGRGTCLRVELPRVR